MSHRVTTRDEIPEAAYYVTAYDSFLKDAIVLPCENLDEAKVVFDNIRAYRSEMKHPRIAKVKPDVKAATTLMPKADAPSWYEPRMGGRYDGIAPLLTEKECGEIMGHRYPFND